MIWGLGIHSRLLIAAGVTLFVGALSHAPAARAADLGGDCCADLEERVAELEATTVRKGNKKVSVTFTARSTRPCCSGTTAPRRTSTSSTTTTSPRGSASRARQRSPAIGRRVIGSRSKHLSASSNAVNQLDDDDGTRSGGVLGDELRLLLLRHSYMYLEQQGARSRCAGASPRHRSTTSPRTPTSPSSKTPCIPTIG